MTMANLCRIRPMPVPFWTLLLLLLSLAPAATGYASWLKCYIDLDDSEVIMNYNVIPFDEAIHKVGIQVRIDNDDDENDGNAIWTTESITYPADKTDTRVSLKLVVPEDLARLDVQYVMESTAGGKFTTRSMCDGTRSHGHGHDVEAILTIDGSQPSIQVWAGWASGHSPVSLTEILRLYRQGESTISGGEL